MATILLTLDGSPFAEQAIPHAVSRLGRTDQLVLLQVVDPAPTLMAPDTFVTEVDVPSCQEYLNRMERHLVERGVKVRTVLRLGSPREVICSVAAEEGASLIVIASHGRTGVKRWLLGSVAESVARQAPCPVWLVRCQALPEPTLREPWNEQVAPISAVLIPLDTSERADEAVRFVQATLARESVTLLLITAANVAWLGQTEGCGEALEEMRHTLEARAHRLRAEGWAVEVALEPGAPAEAILDTAREWGADLIVMTSHGRTGPDRWFLGSVAEKVVRHAPCPVALVRMAPVPV